MIQAALQGTITFHQPFLISSGLSSDGVDLRARADAKVPAASIKGVMRAAARDILELNAGLVEQVFGRPGRKGTWAWTHAGSAEDFTTWTRTRNRLDAATHTTVEEALAVTDEVYAKGPVAFAIEPLGALETDHLLLLVAAAFAVPSIGSGRNRGMGTVTMRMASPAGITSDDLVAFVQANRRVG